MIKVKPLILNLVISLGVGLVSSLFSMDSMPIYENLNKPALSPPSQLFPIVWIILFILMGISAYIVYISKSKNKREALKIYAFQLIINFVWPILFFNCQVFLFSFIWLVILWIAILFMIVSFYKIKPIAGILQIPYLLWVTFAGYLNIMIYFLNR